MGVSSLRTGGRGGIVSGGLRSPLSAGNSSRLPAWALDEDLGSSEPTGSGLLSNPNGTLFSSTSLDEDTFGSSSSPMVSLESLAAATMKMNETWKYQMNNKRLDGLEDDQSLEPGVSSFDATDDSEVIDWDSQWYYLSEDNKPKGPYSLQKLKEWMELSYFQPDTKIKQDIESSKTLILGDVLKGLRSDESLEPVKPEPVLTQQPSLSGSIVNQSSLLGGREFSFMNENTMPTATQGGYLSSMVSQNLVNPGLQMGGSLLNLSNSSLLEKQTIQASQNQHPMTPNTTPTNMAQFSHPWGFGQQTMDPMMGAGYPFSGMPTHPHFMPAFQGNAGWGAMPTMLNLGGGGQMPSVTDIESELLYVPQDNVFQPFPTNIQPQQPQEPEPIQTFEESTPQTPEEVSEPEQITEAESVSTPQETETEHGEAQKKDKKKSKKEQTKPTEVTKQAKKQPEQPVKQEPVFKSVPPQEVISFAEPKKEEVKGWGVQPTVTTTSTVPTLKQIMEQQKKEATKQTKEAQQKKKEVEQQTSRAVSNPWGVVNTSSAPSLKEIQQEEEAKKKQQKTQKQQTQNNQASVIKKSSSTWGGASPLQFKAVPPEKEVSSTPAIVATSVSVTTPTKVVETKSFQFQAIKPQTVTPATTSTTTAVPPKQEDEGMFWDYTAPAITPVITTASEKKASKKDKKKKASGDKSGSYASATGVANTAPAQAEEEFPSLSNAGKNNPFGTVEVSQEFKDWFKKGLKKLNKSVDPSFMSFLLSLNSDKETIDYMAEYIGNSTAAQKFAQEFIANKSFENPNNQGTKKRK